MLIMSRPIIVMLIMMVLIVMFMLITMLVLTLMMLLTMMLLIMMMLARWQDDSTTMARKGSLTAALKLAGHISRMIEDSSQQDPT